MKKLYLTLSTLVFSAFSSADCGVLPEHKFSLNVQSCQKITLEPGGMRMTDGFKLEQGENVTGIMLTGEVSKNTYHLKQKVDAIDLDFYEEWKEGESKSMFYIGVNATTCEKEFPFTFELREAHLCCDTIPNKELCIVPFPIVFDATKAHPTGGNFWY